MLMRAAMPAYTSGEPPAEFRGPCAEPADFAGEHCGRPPFLQGTPDRVPSFVADIVEELAEPT